MEFVTPEPILFSFNSPAGACPRCQGFGNTIDFDMNRVIPDASLSLDEGAVDPWTKPKYRSWLGNFKKNRSGVRMNVPVCDLTAKERETLDEFIRRFFDHLESKKYKMHVRVFLSRYRGYALCPECKGARLRKEALYVRVNGKNLADVVRMNIAEAQEFFLSLELSPEETAIAEKILVEIRQRLKFLNDVGLEYLTLDRLASTLSGGEAQRIQLATSLGSRLVGACYVLDEPSIGLHSRDTGRLIRILEELRGLGNTIVVVEHDPDVMRAADHIVDLGPGAGEHGGEIVFEGGLAALMADGNRSLTSRYLRHELKVSAPRTRRAVDPRRVMRFSGARVHNLKNIEVEIPLGMMVVVTGVSGSGKSTLVHDVIFRSLEALHKARDAEEDQTVASADPEMDDAPGPQLMCRKVTGAERITTTVMIDQSPIGRTPRSNPVTYIKAFDLIRALFAATRESEKRGYTAGHFSFNVPGGRCEVCQGDGTVTVEMQFLADVELICEECKGTRYKSGILEIRYNNLNIHEVLQAHGARGDGLLPCGAAPGAAPEGAGRCGAGVPAAGAIRHDAFRRRGAARQTGIAPGDVEQRRHALHLRRADDRPALRRHRETAGHVPEADREWRQPDHHRAQSGRDQGGRLGDRSGARRAGQRGGCVVAAGTPETIAQVTEGYTGRYLREALEA